MIEFTGRNAQAELDKNIPQKQINEVRDSISGKSTKSLIKEKDKIIMDYAKDSGLEINEIHQAIKGFKQLHTESNTKISSNRMTSRYNDTFGNFSNSN